MSSVGWSLFLLGCSPPVRCVRVGPTSKLWLSHILKMRYPRDMIKLRGGSVLLPPLHFIVLLFLLYVPLARFSMFFRGPLHTYKYLLLAFIGRNICRVRRFFCERGRNICEKEKLCRVLRRAHSGKESSANLACSFERRRDPGLLTHAFSCIYLAAMLSN